MITDTALIYGDTWLEHLAIEARVNPLFASWLSEHSEAVTPVNSKEVTPRHDSIAEFVQQFQPEIKKCWGNAFNCALHVPGVRIVHGYSMSGPIAIEHAWNVFDNMHFDLTAESNNVGPNKEFSRSDLEAGRKETKEHIAIRTFSELDYLTLQDECEWDNLALRYVAFNYGDSPFRLKCLSKARLLELNRQSVEESCDESVLMSLPEDFQSVVVFATYHGNDVRLGVALADLSEGRNRLDESELCILRVAPDVYDSLGHISIEKPPFMSD
ncbi:MAG: hypothetical protein WD049_09125 [Candidatus Paceibacterota bacterium]